MIKEHNGISELDLNYHRSSINCNKISLSCTFCQTPLHVFLTNVYGGKRHLSEEHSVGHTGHNICFKRWNYMCNLSPSPIISFFFSTAVFTRVAYCHLSKRVLTYFSSNHSNGFRNLLAYIFLFFSLFFHVPLLSLIYWFFFSLLFNVIQPHNSFLYMQKQFLFELPRNPIECAVIL